MEASGEDRVQGVRSRRARGAWVAAVAAATLAAVAGCGRGNAYVAPPPPEVSVANPLRQAVTSYLEYTGTTRAVERVDLRARVRGFLKQKLFRAGSDVKAGQLLLVIDEEPFQVAVEQARAKRAEAGAALRKAEESKAREVAAAQLDVDEAQLVLARLDEMRNRALLVRNAGSREELDKSEANRKRFEAQVEADRANLEQARADYETNILSAQSNLKAAEAQLRVAEIDLGYCRIFAPIDGRISLSERDVGNYVGDGQATVLATIVKVDPIYAFVNVGEDDFLRLQKQSRRAAGSPASASVTDLVGSGSAPAGDARAAAIPLEMGLGDEEGYPHAGRIDYIDPVVDAGTGTVRARGIYPNPDSLITPGLFVRVRVPFERREDALLVPERALGADQAGTFLLVVGKDDVVERRAVKPGTEHGDLRVVDGKIAPGDRVVVDGLQRARPGAKVKPKLVPAAEVAGAGAAPEKVKVAEAD